MEQISLLLYLLHSYRAALHTLDNFKDTPEEKLDEFEVTVDYLAMCGLALWDLACLSFLRNTFPE